MNNNEVAHLWANKSRERASGSHFYFDGDTIYSYGGHFPIARHYKGCVLFTNKRHRVTTAKHKRIVLNACHHLTRFTTSRVNDEPGRCHVQEYCERIKSLVEYAAKARNPDAALQILESAVTEANLFCKTFGFKTRFAMPSNWDDLKAKAKASAERERKAKAIKQAKLETEAAETIQRWLTGEMVTIPHFIGTVYLRKIVRDNVTPCGQMIEMQTSKGALVPLDEAHKAFRFAVAMRARGWHRNGDSFQVGSYQLDAVNEQGVVAGCHRIAWPEIERFAKAQGWTA